MASIIDEFSYDVFLSFRGEDTRYGFTGNLKKALDDKGVCTFMDDEELQKGDEITPSLLKAIEDSKIAIVVLSKNYASSSFCLEELSKIIDSMKDKADRSILPVFHKVDPSDVRKLKKTYGEAMDKHEGSSSHNMNRWKASLQQVANLSGFHYKKGEMYEHEFIGKIVEEVFKKITLGITLHVGDYLVGLEPQKQRVISLLNVGSDDTVHMIGIHGIGGIGKTTLALEVYNSIIHQFQCSCFLKVRENYHKNGLELQKILLTQIVKKNIDINSVEEGISILRKMLSKKKVLLLLDDVDNEKQLQAIAGKSNWFGLGSRVIITTRNQRLLTLHGVERTYEVKELNNKDAFELVRWNAFKNEKTDNVFSGYVHVLERAVAYASGLPLALEVIGSHFSNRTIEECKCTLDQCERVPDKKIQMTLQLSFDALEEEEKFVFLDIACCFKGCELRRVEQILNAHHGYSIKNHINVLVEKSLIKISESGTVTLHDLVEDMGKDIVKQESPNPGERSRLWDSKDINEVLKENKEASKIGIIYVNERIKVEQDGKAFNKMKNLKTLLIDDPGHFDGTLKHLPNSLRVLDCRATSLPLAVFRNKKFQNMRVLNFDHPMLNLLQLHDLSNFPNLEELSIQNYWGKFTSDKSVGFLRNLKILRIISCSVIKSVPPLDCPSLIELDLSNCSRLESFSLTVNRFVGNLKILRLKNCIKIRIIPLNMLHSLEELNLNGCNSLETFSHVVGLGEKLKTMTFRSCYKLRSIPTLKLASLEELDLSNCTSLQNFPSVVNRFLGKLKILRVDNCHNLKSIPPSKLDLLEELDLSNCYMVKRFLLSVGEFLGKVKTMRLAHCHNIKSIPPLKLDSLEKLDLSNCTSLESFSHVVGLGEKLKTLSVRSCFKLRSIPPLKLTSLEELDLSYCTNLESFPLVVDEFLGKLKILLVANCHNLKSIPPLKLDSLEKLDLSNCYRLESFPAVVDGFLPKLKTLRVTSCHNLKSIPPLKLDSLEKLDLSNCYRLESFPAVVDGFLPKLKTLRVTSCHNLRSIPPLKLNSLEELDLSFCYSLESFPSVVDGLLDKLKFLNIEHCIMLRSIPPVRLTLLEKFNLSYCLSLESFPEILGEITNIPRVRLYETPIKQLPFPFQHLTPPPTSYPCRCGIVHLPNRVAAMSMLAEVTIKGEGKVSPMQSSHVEYICLRNCKLSDEYLSTSLMLFAKVKELHLTNNQFTVLPKSIEKCHFLWRLILDDCEELQEIKGIPPCLRMLSALNCQSLTSSSKSKLLNQELHEVGNTWFRLPRAKIPEWFDHQCPEGLSISFWFRNKFPDIVLCVGSPFTWLPNHQHRVRVIINGNTFFYTHGLNIGSSLKKMYHLHLFHMKMENFNDNMDKALLENKWNHAEVDLGFAFQKSGIHVLKGKSNMKDIRFNDPENDANIVLHPGC